ncbi:50S ribosomal protein L23 [Blattabacterium cuenoti]|uniref:50S ribosomal protein L23 n=1 Tax=Blattabacterium cuenoti TaxID=1653831 RepID=UPI001EEB08B1|nr:50S ribosomal protein L23 [Blattabacterium cuenoti]
MIIKYFLTKKTVEDEKNLHCYTFIVSNIKYNKNQIKKEIIELFGFPIKNIRTMIYPKKNKSKFTKKGVLYGRSNSFKKVKIQFKEDKNVDLSNKKNIINVSKEIKTNNTRTKV